MCADDIGASLKSLEALKVMRWIFQMADEAASLELAVQKCNLVPYSCFPNLHTFEIIRDWLFSNVPEWACFRIAGSAEYLGIHMGPLAFREQWIKPFEKYFHNSFLVAQAGLSAKISAIAYS
eukprot:2625849-Karenia_brevis.AAC.1